MIRDFEEGSIVTFSALCQKKEIKLTKAGSQYGDLTLVDQSGSITAKAWNFGDVAEIEVGMVVRVDSAEITTFNDFLQVKITKPCVKLDEDPMSYCPSTRFNIESMLNNLTKILSTVQDPWCSKLIECYFNDKHITSMLSRSSAAVSVHHNFVGGLLEHTLYVTRMCELAASVYKWVNRDLLITAAFAHDMGKIDEISLFPENQYTDFGGFVGHVVGSAMIVERYCNSIPGFPEDIKLKLEHCMLAHHGQLEFGSPKLPVIPEAYILSQLDNLDAKLKIFESEDTSVGVWSTYNRYLGTRITSGAFKHEEK